MRLDDIVSALEPMLNDEARRSVTLKGVAF